MTPGFGVRGSQGEPSVSRGVGEAPPGGSFQVKAAEAWASVRRSERGREQGGERTRALGSRPRRAKVDRPRGTGSDNWILAKEW